VDKQWRKPRIFSFSTRVLPKCNVPSYRDQSVREDERHGDLSGARARMGLANYRDPRFGLAGSGSVDTTGVGACGALAKDCCRASSLPDKALTWPDNRFVSA
jgi:hypothetical protein